MIFLWVKQQDLPKEPDCFRLWFHCCYIRCARGPHQESFLKSCKWRAPGLYTEITTYKPSNFFYKFIKEKKKARFSLQLSWYIRTTLSLINLYIYSRKWQLAYFSFIIPIFNDHTRVLVHLVVNRYATLVRLVVIRYAT